MALPVGLSDVTNTVKMLRDFFRSRRSKRVDAKVFEALGNQALWTTPRPMTGGGERAVRAGEIADVVSLPPEVVADSLERLEAAGRVRQHGGTLGNRAPYWTVVRRW